MSAFTVETEIKGTGHSLRVEWREGGRLSVSPPEATRSIELLFDLPGRIPVPGFGWVERSLKDPQAALLTVLDGIDDPLYGEPQVTRSNFPDPEDEIGIDEAGEPEVIFEGVFPSDE